MEKKIEKWPFIDDSGIHLQEGRFYGFWDAGGVYGGCDGFATRSDAVAAIAKEYDEWCSEENKETFIGTTPGDLGEKAVTVLSGREFIDRLFFVCQDGNGDLSDYGRWSE